MCPRKLIKIWLDLLDSTEGEKWVEIHWARFTHWVGVGGGGQRWPEIEEISRKLTCSMLVWLSEVVGGG